MSDSKNTDQVKNKKSLKETLSTGKGRELFLYFVFGILTTIVNLAVFIIFDIVFKSQEWNVSLFGIHFDLLVVVTNVVAWVVSVYFAFATNRAFVFRSKGPYFKEMLAFAASRIATLLVFEIGLFSACVMVLENAFDIGKDETFIKILFFNVTYLYVVKAFTSVFVVIANYILSKLFVFSNGKKKGLGKKQESASIATDDESTSSEEK